MRVLHVCLVEQHDTCATDVYARGTLSLMGSRGGGEERERVEKVRKIGGLKEQAKYLFFSALLTFTDAWWC